MSAGSRNGGEPAPIRERPAAENPWHSETSLVAAVDVFRSAIRDGADIEVAAMQAGFANPRPALLGLAWLELVAAGHEISFTEADRSGPMSEIWTYAEAARLRLTAHQHCLEHPRAVPQWHRAADQMVEGLGVDRAGQGVPPIMATGPHPTEEELAEAAAMIDREQYPDGHDVVQSSRRF